MNTTTKSTLSTLTTTLTQHYDLAEAEQADDLADNNNTAHADAEDADAKGADAENADAEHANHADAELAEDGRNDHFATERVLYFGRIGSFVAQLGWTEGSQSID